MEFWIRILEILNTRMDTPDMYGEFHLAFWVLTLLVTALLCFLYKKGVIKSVNKVILVTTLLVIALEIIKLTVINLTDDGNGMVFDFNWKHFPWQVCSMPMYVGLLACITRRGRVHDALCSFLATFAIFAGTAVMVYPGTVFIDIVAVNVQTMICHGSMLCIGVFLYYTGHVKAEPPTIIKAIPVFAVSLTVAIIINELGYRAGFNELCEFSMFFISPYVESILPIYNYLQTVLPFFWCVVIYAEAFIFVSFLVLCVAMAIKRISSKTRNTKKQKTVSKR